MMKKLSISSQLFIIFFSILLVAGFAFTIVALSMINYTAETQVYSRMSTYANVINSSRYGPGEQERAVSFDDMEIEYVINRNNMFQNDMQQFKSFDLNKMINDEDLNRIIAEINEKLSSVTGQKDNIFGVQGKTLNYANSTVYYVCRIKSYTTDISQIEYAITFTNSTYSSNLVNSLSAQLLSIFFVLLFLAIALIFLWSRHFTKRISNLQNHILSLPKNKYEKVYIDDSADEIGQLSRSVETMRKEISQIEFTKQEMLQNLSHDFKTPIAVIKSYAEAIEDGVESTEALKLIIEQADLLKNKVVKLLQYNSLEYLDHSKELEDVDMSEVINEVYVTYKHQSEIIKLDVEEGVTFKGYRENWSIVVSNILDNAIRFAKSEIKIVLRQGRLRIYNDGEPIDEKFSNSIFKPYEKGSNGQFGLGMSIVMKTVDFFGMDLRVQNESPVGVSFIIESKNIN